MTNPFEARSNLYDDSHRDDDIETFIRGIVETTVFIRNNIPILHRIINNVDEFLSKRIDRLMDIIIDNICKIHPKKMVTDTVRQIHIKFNSLTAPKTILTPIRVNEEVIKTVMKAA